MIFELLKINHLIILRSQSESNINSFFQGFSKSMFECAWAFDAIKYAPLDLKGQHHRLIGYNKDVNPIKRIQ